MGTIIVLADDEADLRAVYAECLRHAGYEVREAADGREALRLVADCWPALLILDVWMPDVNGFEVLDRLRFEPCATTLKVVMLTNLADADALLEGFSGGLADYWIKGLSLDEFLRRVRGVLADDPVAYDPS